MDKVELVEQTKTISKKKLKIPLSILKEKFPKELKNAQFSYTEFVLCNDLNEEEFLSCIWEENYSADNSVELKISMLTSEKLTDI